MKIIDTNIPEVKILEPQIYKDERGYFYESFSDEWFRENVCDTTFVQENQSYSVLNVVRGFHFQKPPYAQSKLVRCVRGGIIDFAVDIRKDSPTYGQTVHVLLSERNHRQLFVPRGFAHGFVAIGYDNLVQYKVDNPYNKDSEGSIKWNDPDLDIGNIIDVWFGGIDSMMQSDKDFKAPLLKDIETVFDYNEKLY